MDFFDEFGIVLPEFADLSFAVGFLFGGASEVIEGGKDGDAGEGGEGVDEDIAEETGAAGGEGLVEFVDQGVEGGKSEAGEESEARGEFVEVAKVVIPRGAE